MAKKTWKSLGLVLAFLGFSYGSLILSSEINRSFGENTGNLKSLVLMAIPFVCLTASLFTYVIKNHLKEDVNEVTDKISVLYLVAGLVIVVTIVVGFYRILPKPDSEFSFPLLDMMVWTIYILLPIAIGIAGFAFVGVTFLILRLSNKYPKAIYLIAMISMIIWWNELPGEGGLEAIARPAGAGSYYSDTNWYFMRDNRVYVYEWHNGEDVFFHVTLEGDKKEIISSSDKLRNARFFLAYEQEAIYYTSFHNRVKKVDLRNGKIEELYSGSLALIPDTLVKNHVLAGYSYGPNNDPANAIVGWLHLETGALEKKKILKLSEHGYHYSEEEDTIYYSCKEKTQYHIYEDEDIVFTTEREIDAVFVQNNFLYSISPNAIIKIDLENYQVVEETEGSGFRKMPVLNNPNRNMIELGTAMSGLNYFYDYDGGLYVFDDKAMQFEWITNFGFVKHGSTYGEYSLFRSKEDVLLYHPQKRTLHKYSGVMNYSIQDNILYLLKIEGERYQHEKEPHFYIEKINLSAEK
ncbi:hypothetical protein [Tindallia californiensis]|uniref:Uncharacterized protein n=1 Tax=Tindallia californiensis TaxID=159292 RepID=A0A1H3KDJ2_9FIRM|nr:hypothetical protein [Tindallia californiensis]SDY50153.1 hypothetical protein SAMN05192546_102317 [Tindallia californiensis]